MQVLEFHISFTKTLITVNIHTIKFLENLDKINFLG
jgi:hypothetical protein